MIQEQTTSEWTGIKGTLGAWHLSSPLRRLAEILVYGDCRSVFLNGVSSHLRGNEIVLDVGAGTGYYSLAIAEKLTTGKVICFDLSQVMLHRLEKMAIKKGLADKIQPLKGEACSIRIEGESVDLVVSNNVFHELSEPGFALREMVRVLKPGGWVIVTDFRDTAIGGLIAAAHHGDAHGPWSVKELETLLAKAGLARVKVSPVRNWVIGAGEK